MLQSIIIQIFMEDYQFYGILSIDRRMLKLFTLIVALAASVSATNIVPSDYVWLNYGKVKLKHINHTHLLVNLPCETRIGVCTVTYSLLPRGWESDASGDLMVPKNEIKTSVYSIAGKIAEPTGLQINISLVVKFEGEYINIWDQQQYMKAQGYNPSVKSYQSLGSTSNNGRSVTDRMNLPSKASVSAMLKSADLIAIQQLVANYSKANIQCRDKYSYGQEIMSQFRISIQKNQARIILEEEKVDKMSIELEKLEIQEKSINQSEIKRLRASLKRMQSQVNSAWKNQKIYEDFAQISLKRLKRNHLSKIKQETQAKDNAQQGQDFGKVLEKLFKKMKNLHQLHITNTVAKIRANIKTSSNETQIRLNKYAYFSRQTQKAMKKLIKLSLIEQMFEQGNEITLQDIFPQSNRLTTAKQLKVIAKRFEEEFEKSKFQCLK